MSSGDSPSDSVEQNQRIFDDNGVDLSLIRYSLSLTANERLRSVENFMNALTTIRRIPNSQI